ncbi:MAG: hypothetical protein HYU77_10345 [Betaproteobacteria bacterium]|nr:hypothetical protein [Betaproteobacteria bacterium]
MKQTSHHYALSSKGCSRKREQITTMRDHIVTNLCIEIEAFEYAPFNKGGGNGKVHKLFGGKLPKAIEALNRGLAA